MADQSNPGRNALILGAVLGMAAAGFGAYVMSTSKIVAPDTHVSGGKSDSSMTAQAEQVKDNLKSDRTILDVAPEGAVINGKPRLAPLFFSTELWQVSDDAKKDNIITDIYAPASPNVHADVPNAWFLKEGIADALGRADGLSMDSDKDGFSNKEEFLAHSSPSDPKSYPALVRVNEQPKLEVAANGIRRTSCIISAAGSLQFEANPASVEIRMYKNEGDMMPMYKKTVKPGESFGVKDGDNRFTLVKFDKVTRTDYSGAPTAITVIEVQDNETADPDKKKFVVVPGTPKIAKAPSPDKVCGRQISDVTVTLHVTAGANAGAVIKCQEKGSFEIPGGLGEGKPLKATLESIDKGGSVNIRVEGIESPVNVPKAASKAAAPAQ